MAMSPSTQSRCLALIEHYAVSQTPFYQQAKFIKGKNDLDVRLSKGNYGGLFYLGACHGRPEIIATLSSFVRDLYTSKQDRVVLFVEGLEWIQRGCQAEYAEVSVINELAQCLSQDPGLQVSSVRATVSFLEPSVVNALKPSVPLVEQFYCLAMQDLVDYGVMAVQPGARNLGYKALQKHMYDALLADLPDKIPHHYKLLSGKEKDSLLQRVEEKTQLLAHAIVWIKTLPKDELQSKVLDQYPGFSFAQVMNEKMYQLLNKDNHFRDYLIQAVACSNEMSIKNIYWPWLEKINAENPTYIFMMLGHMHRPCYDLVLQSLESNVWSPCDDGKRKLAQQDAPCLVRQLAHEGYGIFSAWRHPMPQSVAEWSIDVVADVVSEAHHKQLGILSKSMGVGFFTQVDKQTMFVIRDVNGEGLKDKALPQKNMQSA